MFTYDVTATEPLGFQVSVSGPHPRGTDLIDDFGSLHEAEVFADRMRVIDAAGLTSSLCRRIVHDFDGRWTTLQPTI